VVGHEQESVVVAAEVNHHAAENADTWRQPMTNTPIGGIAPPRRTTTNSLDVYERRARRSPDCGLEVEVEKPMRVISRDSNRAWGKELARQLLWKLRATAAGLSPTRRFARSRRDMRPASTGRCRDIPPPNAIGARSPIERLTGMTRLGEPAGFDGACVLSPHDGLALGPRGPRPKFCGLIYGRAHS
jgi:hypothetical protein